MTVAWIAAALALVVGLGGGGAAAVNALTGSSGTPGVGDGDVSDALVIDEGEDIAYRDADGTLVPAGRAVLTTGFDLESDLDYGFIERDSTTVIRYENISDHDDSGGPVRAQDPGAGTWYAVGATSFGEETDATSAGAMAVAPLVAANDFTLLIPGPA